MKISTKGRYGLSFLLDILKHYDGSPVRLRDIAKRQEISEKYLEQIASILQKAGVVGSIRGSNGGYFMRREAKELSVGEILRIMEGDLAPAPCVSEGAMPCKRKNYCSNVILWGKINSAIHAVVDNISLEDMASWK